MQDRRLRDIDRRTLDPDPKGARARVAQRVLLAEPDSALSEMYRSVLESDGWAVEVVSHGHEALTRASATRPGVLLLSTVPDLPAMTVLKRLRDNDSTRDLPVIVLTNFGDEADVQWWHELGALGRLTKSRSMRERLSETIVGLLERRTSAGDRRVPIRPGPQPSES
jgi:DNA-binding response OmpR family regulator